MGKEVDTAKGKIKQAVGDLRHAWRRPTIHGNETNQRETAVWTGSFRF